MYNLQASLSFKSCTQAILKLRQIEIQLKKWPKLDQNTMHFTSYLKL